MGGGALLFAWRTQECGTFEEMRMKLRGVCLGVAALGLVIATCAATDSVQAAQHRGYTARHHAGAYTTRRICYLRQHPRLAERRVCRSVGGYSIAAVTSANDP